MVTFIYIQKDAIQTRAVVRNTFMDSWSTHTDYVPINKNIFKISRNSLDTGTYLKPCSLIISKIVFTAILENRNCASFFALSNGTNNSDG